VAAEAAEAAGNRSPAAVEDAHIPAAAVVVAAGAGVAR